MGIVMPQKNEQIVWDESLSFLYRDATSLFFDDVVNQSRMKWQTINCKST